MASFQRLAAANAAVVLALAAGCQTVPRSHPTTVSPQQVGALTSAAEAALQQGDCRTASQDYATAASAGSVNVAHRATQVAVTCQDLPAAWQAAQRWHALAPGNEEASLIYGTVALTLYRIPEARAALTPLVGGSGRQAERNELSLLGLLSQDPDIGAAATLAALGGTVDAHSSPVMLTAFGALALEAFNFELAAKHAQQVLARDPRSGVALRLLAQVQALQGDASAALATAREAMQADPDRSTFELANVLTSLDRYHEARQELERLRNAGVSAAEIDRRLALLAYQSGDIPEARRRFIALVNNGEAGEEALLYLGDIAVRSGDNDTALTDYRQLSETPLALTAGTRAAGVLLDEGQRSQALGVFDSYESEHPENAVDVALAKADLFADHGDAKDGLAFIAAALQRFPQHPRLEYERATLLERAGNVRASIEAFRQLLRARPGDPSLMNALGYTLADHRMQLSRAESLIRRALAVTPDNPAVLDSLGWVRLRRGDTRSALPLLAQAYRISHDAEIAAHWGEALWVGGQHAEARKVWAAALARHPDSRALKETMRRLVPPGQG
ncbi:MAG: tetratricopeptide repeat protein [Steroidobacteraceae bacterium]